MKIVAIGDIHGRDCWKLIVKQEADADKFVFMGDYLDTHDEISGTDQRMNFHQIREFKQANPNKVVLLLGNHDFHYLDVADGEQYGGYSAKDAVINRVIMESAIRNEEVQVAYAVKPFLFTHAGVTIMWIMNAVEKKEITPENVEETINGLFLKDPRHFQFTGHGTDPSGNDLGQSPLWVRPKLLSENPLPGFIHVVGHTQFPYLDVTHNSQMIPVDTLGTSGQYLVIDTATGLLSVGILPKGE